MAENVEMLPECMKSVVRLKGSSYIQIEQMSGSTQDGIYSVVSIC